MRQFCEINFSQHVRQHKMYERIVIRTSHKIPFTFKLRQLINILGTNSEHDTFLAFQNII